MPQSPSVTKTVCNALILNYTLDNSNVIITIIYMYNLNSINPQLHIRPFFICPCNLFQCTAATVGYDQLIFFAQEGEGEVEVCLRITNLPADGLECDVTVDLSAVDGLKTGTYV